MARMILNISAAVALLLVGSAAGAPDLQEPHRACLQASSGGLTWYYDVRTDVSGTTLDRWKLNDGWSYVDRNAYAAFHLPEGGRSTWDEGVAFAATMQTRNAWLNNEPTNTATWEYDADAGEDVMVWKTTVQAAEQDYVFRSSQCLDLLPPGVPSEPQEPDTEAPCPETDVPTQPQEPDTQAPSAILHACLEASSGGMTYYYEIHSDRSNDAEGTTFDRYTVDGGVDTFVDSNAFAALRQPDGDLPWAQGIQFTDAMQARGVWVNQDPTKSATIEHDAVSGEDTLTFHTTVDGGLQDYIFRTSQCRGSDVPSEPQEPDTAAPSHETDVPTEPQEPDATAASAILRACLEASSGGVTYYYEIVSDAVNDAEGTTFDRYTVDGGVDTFVDSNAFAALRQPDGDLPWAQGIQFTDAMQARGVWVNEAPTMSATIEHDAVSGEDTLTFHTTVDGGLQDYIFRTSQCR